jgi:Zn ribbon nucleic-acid-binding protein
MFEDIIGNTYSKKKSKIESAAEACPVCKATDVAPIWGMFISLHEYVQTMECVVCSSKWSILYDEDLNIKDVIIL